MLGRSTRALNNHGDTIVEVLVVLAVLGLAIGISYSTANRSLLTTRAAQENSQATELLQGQIEELRYLAPPGSGQNIYQTSKYFCVDGSSNTVITGFGGTFAPSDLQNYAYYPNKCVNGFYHLAIAWDQLSDDTFTLTAHWDDVQGQGQDTATLTYRVHQ